MAAGVLTAEGAKLIDPSGQLPAGIPLKEIILMTYGALTMQTTQLDILDSAGVLNPFAADWWQRNTNRIPLSREPFLRSEVSHDA